VRTLSDPFGQLRLDSSTVRLLIPIRTEEDLDRLERERRDRYVNRIRARYLNIAISKVLDSLKKPALREAVIETSKGPIRRDLVCVYTRPIDDEITCLAYARTNEIINEFGRSRCD